MLAYTGTCIFRLDGINTNAIRTLTAKGKYRIEYQGSTALVYLNGNLIQTVDTVDEEKNPRFRINANSTLKLRNWLHY